MQRTLQPAIERAVLGQRLQHIGAEAADRAFLDGDQHLVLARQPQQQIGVERLGKARIGDRGRQAERGQFVGRLQAFAEPRAVGQQRHLVAFAHDAALADFERQCLLPASARRGLRRADSATPTAGRRSRLASPPCAPARLRRPPPSARSRAGSRDRRHRTRRHGSGRRRRPDRRGRWRSAPAAAGWRCRAPPGRRRAAGRSNRSSRTA